jgi:hypothetical protein
MAKLVLNNVTFDYDLGCKIAKLKYGDVCPEVLSPLADFWNDIVPATFSDIAQLENLEQRRIGIGALGIERLISEVNPKLIDKKTLDKSTTWINGEGKLETIEYKDTYELYKVKGSVFSQGLGNHQTMADCFYVKCKDTSTDREYLIWIEPQSVYRTNFTNHTSRDSWYDRTNGYKELNAIECVAWTITTNVPQGNIEKILRQGDCIMIKPQGKYEPLATPRHLTQVEYETLIVAES